MNQKSFRVSLSKEQLTFSAAHFITFADNICERLHGHNYGVRCQVYGSLEKNGYVVDFIALRDQLAAVVAELDHRVLLPTGHETISVMQEGNEIVARFEDKRWVFPQEDCVLLPIVNTTAEWLASYLVDRLVANESDWSHPGIAKIVIGVDENQGQWGECAWVRPSSVDNAG